MFRACAIFLFLQCLAVFAAPAESPEEIPPFQPPIKALAPDFWEAHGNQIIFGAAGFLLAVGFLALVINRKRRPAPVNPVEQARHALEQIRNQSPGDLTTISQVTRRGLAALLQLPQWEMTTAEFCEALEHRTNALSQDAPVQTEAVTAGLEPSSRVNLSGLARRIRGFLLRCDALKFAPRGEGPQPWDAAGEALEIIDVAASSQRAHHDKEVAR